MDPDIAYERATDLTRPLADRITSAHALRDWIANGGFPPAVWSAREAPYAIDRLVANLENIREGR